MTGRLRVACDAFRLQALRKSVLCWFALSRGTKFDDDTSDEVVRTKVRTLIASQPPIRASKYKATFSPVLRQIWARAVTIPVAQWDVESVERWDASRDQRAGGSGTGNEFLFDSLEMVDFDTFDTDETRDNQKELDRGRKLQQGGHVLHAALVVTRGIVTNAGVTAAVHFSAQVIPSQRTQPPYLTELMFTKPASSAPRTSTEHGAAQGTATTSQQPAAAGAAVTDMEEAAVPPGGGGDAVSAGKLTLNIEWSYCTCKKGAVRTCGALVAMLLLLLSLSSSLLFWCCCCCCRRGRRRCCCRRCCRC